MDKRIYGLLPNLLQVEPYCDPRTLDHVRRKLSRVGKLVGCSRCGRTGCTLYGSGERKLCKECGGRRG